MQLHLLSFKPISNRCVLNRDFENLIWAWFTLKWGPVQGQMVAKNELLRVCAVYDMGQFWPTWACLVPANTSYPEFIALCATAKRLELAVVQGHPRAIAIALAIQRSLFNSPFTRRLFIILHGETDMRNDQIVHTCSASIALEPTNQIGFETF